MLKEIKYRVGNEPLGDSDSGDILQGYLLAKGDRDIDLIYLPKNSRYTCASISFARFNWDLKMYEAVPSRLISNCYVNIGSGRELRKFQDNVENLWPYHLIKKAFRADNQGD